MDSSLKNKTKDSLGWSALERMTYQVLNFGIQILLARWVDPSEFGLLVLIVIFVTFAQLVIDGGFTQAMIQKDELSRKDISTMFWFNLVASLLIYALLFFCAPFIAAYYAEPRLSLLVRVLSLCVVFRSLGLVHLSVLTRELKFKKLFKVSIPSMIVAGVLGIVAAGFGWEVWALVTFQIANVLFTSGLLWAFSEQGHNPRMEFSLTSLTEMGSFSTSMMGSSLISHAMQNIYGLAIKEMFAFHQLGVYNRARAFHRAPSVALNTIFNRVLFPVFSQIKQDDAKIVAALRTGIPIIVFTVAPLMFFLMIASEEIVLLLLNKKWIEAATLMQWFPIIGIAFPLAAVQLSVIKAKGMGRLFMVATLVKNLTALAVLYFTVQHSVLAVVVGQVGVSLFNNICVNMPICATACGYKLHLQAWDIVPYLAAAAISAVLTWLVFSWAAVGLLVVSLFGKLLLFLSLYLAVNYTLKLEALFRFFNEFRLGLAKIQEVVNPVATS